VCVYLYVYIYIHTYIHIYTYIYIYIYIYIYVCIYKYIYIHMFIHLCRGPFSKYMLVAVYSRCGLIPGQPVNRPPHGTWVKGALQLLSNRHVQIRFAHVHKRVLLLRNVELLTAITSDSPMQPGRTRHTRLAESKLKPPLIMSRSTKVIRTC